MADHPVTAPEPWPSWLEGRTSDDKILTIVTAVADCYGDTSCRGEADHESAGQRHCTALPAAALLRRVLETATARSAERALEAEQALIIKRHNLRERIGDALGESLTRCRQCLLCPVQLDAVMAVLAAEAVPVPSPEPGSVIVPVADLRAVLAVAYDLAGRSPQFARCAEAAGLARPPASGQRSLAVTSQDTA